MSEMFSLRNKTALVTGGGSGIGRAICERFGAAGAEVFVLDRDSGPAEDVAQAIVSAGGRARAVVTDVADESSVRAAVELADRVDVVVNNAGIAHIGGAVDTAPEDLDRVFSVNVKGVHHVLRAVLPRMEAQGGGVVLNLCSIAAKVGLEARFAYSASKGAVFAMTLQVARDYVGKNIRCNCLCPARVHTPFVDGYLARVYPGRESEMFEKLSKAQPIGRMASADEVAAAAHFLCSDDAKFLTGVSYDVDGGVIGLR
jgi:2-keto-3-deoxy-L-fuconate dehydrogenase